MSTALYPSEPLVDHLRPSLFELLAQEQLRDLLHPVVRYVLSYLAQHYPRYFLRIANRHEEFFAGLLLLIERHHLKKHNASLSEHFYQLKLAPDRVIPTPRLSRISPQRYHGLNRRQRWGMLVYLIGLPYVRARLQDYYERLGGSADAEGMSEDVIIPRTLTQRSFKAIYPYANLALDSVLLGYDIAYMFEKTRYYRPWLGWLGVRMVRDDGEAEGVLGGQGASSQRSLLSRLPPILPPLLLLLKLSQWWYSPSSPRHIAITSSVNDIAKTHAAVLPPRPLPVMPGIELHPCLSSNAEAEDADVEPESPPPPYAPLDKQMQGTSAPVPAEVKSNLKSYAVDAVAYGTCPLCGDKWKNPAVLPTGWVVCWRCGWDALEGQGDDEEVDEQDVARVYEGAGADDGGAGSKQQARDRAEKKKRKTKGCCPITGAPIGRGQLRRVLV